MKTTNMKAITADAAEKLIGIERLQELIKRGVVKYARRGSSDSGSFILLDSLPFRERLKIEDFLASTQGQSSIQHPHSNMKSHNHQVVSAKERHSPQEALKVRLRTLRDLLEEVQLFYQSDDMRSSPHNNLQVESSSMQNLYQFLSAQETALTYFLQMYTRFQSAQTRAFQDKL